MAGLPMKGAATGNQVGLTIAELMVAGLVLGIGITGTMSIIGSGRALEHSGGLRRQAAILATAAMEDTLYHHSRYDQLATGTASGDSLLDSLSGRAVAATVSMTVYSPTLVSWGPAPENLDVHYRRIQSKVSWTLDGVKDSVEIFKRVCKIK